jgi:hypothetical protein
MGKWVKAEQMGCGIEIGIRHMKIDQVKNQNEKSRNVHI